MPKEEERGDGERKKEEGKEYEGGGEGEKKGRQGRERGEGETKKVTGEVRKEEESCVEIRIRKEEEGEKEKIIETNSVNSDFVEEKEREKERERYKNTDKKRRENRGRTRSEEQDGGSERREESVASEDTESRSSEIGGARKSQSEETLYWGVPKGGELPPSVAVCFETSPTFLARLQGRILSLLGRGNRYRLPSRISPSRGMPLEVLRRKVKEARQKFLHHTRTSPTSPSKPTQKSKSSSSESSSVSEPPTQVLSTRGSREGVAEPLQQYWGAEEGAAGGEEEIELLQQYLNLQHLARSRKHSAQLRRIRDSLIVKVRSRPNSVVNGGDHTPATSPAHATAPRKDRQQLRDFLLDIGFVQDYSLLNRHGYDLATAAHMDALDLAGAGVTEPLHRMALKHELNLVQRPTQVPDEVPETVEEWLEGLSLQSYVDNFHLNGLYCPLAALNLTKRDLQLMGVYMQGHRKKILLSLAALKETLFRRVNEKDN